MLIKNCLFLLLMAVISHPVSANDLDDGIALDDFISDDIGTNSPNMSYIRSKIKAAKKRGDKDVKNDCHFGSPAIEGKPGQQITNIVTVGGHLIINCDKNSNNYNANENPRK